MYVYLHVHSSVGYFVSDRKSFSQSKIRMASAPGLDVTTNPSAWLSLENCVFLVLFSKNFVLMFWLVRKIQVQSF